VRLDRYLLIACVTLSQACDSKRSEPAPVASGSEPPKPEPELVVTATQQGILVDGKLIEAFVDGALPADVVDDKYRPRKLVPILGKVTAESVRFVIDRDLPSWIVFQMMAAAPSNVTRFELGTVELRRGQEPSTATLSRDDMLMTASKEVIALEPSATLSARLLEAATRLPDRKRFDLVVDRKTSVARLVEVTTILTAIVEKVGISPNPTDGPSTMAVTFQTDHAVAAYMQKNEKGIRRCFEQSLTRDGPTTGYDVRVTLRFDAKGLADVKTFADRMTPPLAKCLSSAINDWELQLPPGTYDLHILLSVK